MANIDRIVKVDITLGTRAIFQYGFSTLLIMAPFIGSLNRVETVTDADELLDMGVSSTDKLYLAVNDAFSQIPRARQVKIGRRQVDVVNIIPTVSAGATYTLATATKDDDGNVTTRSYETNTTTGATAISIVEDFVSLITADNEAQVVATNNAGILVLTNKQPGAAFRITTGRLMRVDALVAADSITDDLNAINSEDDDWYGLIITSRAQSDILEVAAWTESKIKLFGCCIKEPGAADAGVTSDTGSRLMENQQFRTFWIYHPNAETDFLDAALMAKCFSYTPGSETWANKGLANVTVDRLSETQYIAVTAKNGNTFEWFRNVAITQNGKVAAGEWIDTIRFRDWLAEEIKVREFSMLINRTKVPYTDAGIATIESVLEGALKQGQANGGIAPTEYDSNGNEIPGYAISVPLNADISANDKANRILRNVNFVARLAGAIHAMEINGSVTYENIQGGNN